MSSWIHASAVAALLLSACGPPSRELGPDGRPSWTDCSSAMAEGEHMDHCSFDGECGFADPGAVTRRANVCANGRVLQVGMEETHADEPGPCPGLFEAEADANLALTVAETGCLDVLLCHDLISGNTAVRRLHVCQDAPIGLAGEGSPWVDCAMAAVDATDGDPCLGEWACMGPRTVFADAVSETWLPIFAWCDAGIVRLAPTQTALAAPP